MDLIQCLQILVIKLHNLEVLFDAGWSDRLGEDDVASADCSKVSMRGAESGIASSDSDLP